MRYVKDNVIKTINDIRLENPNISIPDYYDLSGIGYETLVETDAPAQDGFIAVENGVIGNKLQWKLNPITAYTPESITPRQARLALLQAGLLDAVEAMVANNREMQIWWEYCNDVERNNEHIINAGMVLGITPTQLDELFITGSKL